MTQPARCKVVSLPPKVTNLPPPPVKAQALKLLAKIRATEKALADDRQELRKLATQFSKEEGYMCTLSDEAFIRVLTMDD